MAIHHLTLPDFNEPLPRLPVVARYLGPVLAAARRHSGYRYDEADPRGSNHPWIGSGAKVIPTGSRQRRSSLRT